VKYLLDTNICIYLMKNQSPSVALKFATLRVGDVRISSITQAELEQGVLLQPELIADRRKQLDELLCLIPALAFDGKSARCYGDLRAQGKQLRRNRFDTLIAAQAIASNLILVTNNVADFTGIESLVLENWIDDGKPDK